jgi:transcriptional regulator with XRE-family HTH domain
LFSILDDMLADVVHGARVARGLTLREAARRIGISPAYLSSLEQGRNPATGRPPVPSPPVLAEIARVLDLDLEVLFGLVATVRPSAHVMLIQLGRGTLPAVDGARRAVGSDVEEWWEVSELLGLNAGRYCRAQAMEALVARLEHAPATGGPQGLIFGAAARPLARCADPFELLAAEETWEHDVACACVEHLGRAPAANVCVYRETDIRALPKVDPLIFALGLVRSHPRIAAQCEDGDVATGVDATALLLEALRPDAVAAATWTQLAAAAARGLGRWAPPR